ncbi:MAG TPA: peroxidase-related enzyme [Longimicrobium sp.]
MAHIALREGLPGIRALLDFDPGTAAPLSALAEVLLRRGEGLSRGERELIATHVSTLNRCTFCATTHGAAARHLLGERAPLVDAVQVDYLSAPVTPRLRALLSIAARVQEGGRAVGDQDVQAARAHGATDAEIHDTVLIAAAFCMYNRYVDGLATWTPDDPAGYDRMGALLAEEGYVR